MAQEIDAIRDEMKKLYKEGALPCGQDFIQDLDQLAREAGEMMDGDDRNRTHFALQKFWEHAGKVMGVDKDPKTSVLYLKIWGLVVRYRSW